LFSRFKVLIFSRFMIIIGPNIPPPVYSTEDTSCSMMILIFFLNFSRIVVNRSWSVRGYHHSLDFASFLVNCFFASSRLEAAEPIFPFLRGSLPRG
jgi:hypothetical protein